jgi:hypothetical protein
MRNWNKNWKLIAIVKGNKNRKKGKNDEP